MARVTVEDCTKVVPNRFELVILASQRARDIASGSMLTVDRDNDKDPVVALREIADKSIDVDALLEIIVQKNQRYLQSDATRTQQDTEADDEFYEESSLLQEELAMMPGGINEEDDFDEDLDIEELDEEGEENDEGEEYMDDGDFDEDSPMFEDENIEDEE